MKLSNLIAAGLTATLLATGASYAQTAPAAPAEVQVMVKNQAAAQMPEVMALVEELKAQGFTYIEIRATLLGRAKVMAYGADSVREVVLSSATGEVMRDVMRAHDGSMAAGREAMQAEMGGEMGGNMESNMGDMGNQAGEAMGNMGDRAGEAMGNVADKVGGAMGGMTGGMGRN